MSRMDIFDTAGDAAWDFIGPAAYTDTAGDNSPWRVKITGAAPPTATLGNVSGGIGELTLALEATNQVQNVCLYHGNLLQFDIDNLLSVEWRIKMGQAAFTTGSVFSFGVGSDRSDTYTSMTAFAAFSLTGATSTTLVYAETDDNVTDVAPASTGKTLVAAYKHFMIDFSNGTSDVRFFVGGEPVLQGTTFNMSGYTAGLQPYAQISKASNTNADTAIIDYCRIKCRRPV